MKLEDFKIGEFFYTGSGKWLCVDKGTWTVVAIMANRASKIEIGSHSDAQLMVFESIDFGGCSPADRFS